MTILELLDRLNDSLVTQGREPIAFESDCREGMRHLRRYRRRAPARTSGQRHDVPTAPAQLLRRPDRTPRAVPVRGLPRRARPDRRPVGAGPHHRGRWLRLGGRRYRPDADTVQIRMRWPRRRWTSPRASAAARVWRPARTVGNLFTGAKLVHLSLLPHGRQERRVPGQVDGRAAEADSGHAHCSANARRYARRASRSPRSPPSTTNNAAPGWLESPADSMLDAKWLREYDQRALQ